MSEVKKVLFIVNKFAGTGFQSQVEGRILDICSENNAECSIEYTRSRGHATELALQGVQNKFHFVAAVGGDGTINEVAQGMLHSSVPMGIIPKGSGNGLARHLGIAMDIRGALNNLFNSRIVEIDTFTVNGKLSLNVSGVGFDGHIANLFSKKIKRGLIGYSKLAFKEFFSFEEFPLTLTVENKILEKNAFVVSIANSSQFGNNAYIAPRASVCDQILQVVIMKKMPLHRIDLIYSLFNQTLDKHTAYCETIPVKKISIQTKEPISYHVDGEPCGEHSEFNIEVIARSLKMLVPNHSMAI